MLLDAEIQNKVNQAEKGAGSLPRGVKDAKKWEVAQQFEAMFTHEMVKAMRKTIPEGEKDQSGSGREIFEGMLDEKYADLMAHQSGSRGLAMTVYKELERQEGHEIPELNEIKPSITPAKALWSPLRTPMENNDLRSNPFQSARPAGLLRIDSTESSKIQKSPKAYEEHIQDAAKRYDLDPHLIRSVMMQESGGNARIVSPVGAKGLMQLMDGTARSLGVKDSFDPRQNIMGGALFLRKMLNQYNGSEKLALAAYNAGPGNVNKYDGVPPFAETQSYVRKVLSRRDGFARAEGAAS